MTKLPKLLFVDTNVWLDFYRARNDAALNLLKHLESLSNRIVVTHQLEMEFKKNRHNAMQDGLQVLQPPKQICRPAIFSDAKEIKAIQDGIKQVSTRIDRLKDRLIKGLKKPTLHDPVFKICQRIFHKSDDLVLTIRRRIISLSNLSGDGETSLASCLLVIRSRRFAGRPAVFSLPDFERRLQDEHRVVDQIPFGVR